MTLKFNMVPEVVEVHVRAKFHQAECSGSWVIVLTEKKQRRKRYGPSLPRGHASSNNIYWWPTFARQLHVRILGKVKNNKHIIGRQCVLQNYVKSRLFLRLCLLRKIRTISLKFTDVFLRSRRTDEPRLASARKSSTNSTEDLPWLRESSWRSEQFIPIQTAATTTQLHVSQP